MALFDFLKRKEDNEKAKNSAGKKAEESLIAKEPKKFEKIKISEKPKAIGQDRSFSYTVVKEPHISEKSTYLAEENHYVFKVYGNANKPEIKKAVEGIYGVDVLSVNMIKIPKKKRRIGKAEGFKKGYKKAIVKIKEGQKIEIF